MIFDLSSISNMKHEALFNYVLLILALGIFSLGFFPYQASVIVTSKKINEEPSKYVQRQKTVLFLIDALRSDFVFEHLEMTNLQKLMVENKTCNFISKAAPPTVTMPRIKAITAGIKPGFIDVIYNFNSPELKVDNIIKIASELGLKVIFYGDDTWIKLFPGKFYRYEGVTSFDVRDYVEVDKNVTKNVLAEIERSDWDVMILHYLGLDHIGHMYGPKSSLISQKLKEMDIVLNLVAQKLFIDQKETNNCPMLILMGDHGMSDGGGHGGTSRAEILTPLIFISNAHCLSGCGQKPMEVNQVDIASTLSTIWGIPIPKNNIGKLITEVLPPMENLSILNALITNAKQLFKVAEANSLTLPSETMFTERELPIKESIYHYSTLLQKVSSQLLGEGGNFDILQMGLAIMLIMKIFLMTLVSFTSHQDLQFRCNILVIVLIVTASVILSQILCYFGSIQSAMCELTFGTILKLLVLMFGIFFNLKTLNNKKQISSVLLSRGLKMLSIEETILLVFFSIHPLILLATSFIEEEHQLFYFALTSVHVVLLYKSFISFWKHNSLHYPRPKSLNQRDILSWTRPYRALTHLLGNTWIIFLLCYMRKFNQTGNKWLHLSDIGEWLRANNSYLMIGVVVSLGIILMSITEWNYWLTCDITVLLVVIQSHFQCIPGITLSETSAAILALLINLGRSILKITIHADSLSTTLYETWLIFLCIILRDHNLIVLALTVLTQKLVRDVVLLGLFQTPCVLTLYMLLWAYTAFFYQGNSNSLTTIDVSVGYVFVPFYNILLNGLSVYYHTYGLFILWCIFFFQMIQKFCIKNQIIYEGYHDEILKTLLATRSFTLVVYFASVIFQRYHLFVWSVFAPKVLYELAHTLTLLFVSIVSYLYSKIKVKSND